MTQPPYGSEPPERPQDRPHDPTRAFPTYGRPEQPGTPPTAPGEQQPGTPPPTGPGRQPTDTPTWAAPGQHSAGTSWAAPGQQPQYGQAPPQFGQPQFGQAQPQFGQPQYGQPPYGQVPYGHGYGPGQYPPAYGQPPAAYGYGYLGGSGGTNSLATASLVTGLGGILIGVSAPVAIGLGIAALVQISRRPQAGKGMAIAGVVIGSLVTLGYVALIGLVIAFGSSGDTSGAPNPGSSSVYVDELAIGDCFDKTSVEDEVVRRDCPVEHDGELVASVTLPAGAYPGDKAIDDDADQACAGPFGTYVGKSRDDSELQLAWWTPDKPTWNSGDRRILCAAYGPGTDKLTGTVKNSHR
ncbi:hypothetical protein JOF29_005549 [Kribbella aluminosa]|uniref:Regulator of septum formation n=1 Tax=Kribbella aluminosa TaxID=416017 RepID=A0ABS4US16_9ACTN|nr:DUF4190 domain-containing protein [Kribbella aluminosa]MBP2354439.1 hypothetical protein [Kribbella aluminosa]